MTQESSEQISPVERARKLVKQKEDIEAEIEAHSSILRANGATMETPLVDKDGFPRADIDIYAVRPARARIIMLRNDLKAVMDDIAKVLENIYDPSNAVSQDEAENEESPQAFAKVNGVAPSSPAGQAGLQEEDLIVKFGGLTIRSFTSGSLQPLVQVVAANENRPISIEVLRSGGNKVISLTPRKGWGGKGLLGCHIVPYSSNS
ncbi:proteasome 26S subunit [Coprinopsis marcescibilis]|uniref:Probable 26S proteasome regulatory subunit p27 n=1 Tax=Coprinopsis marcescibilis TaxID=230819 RepID=A0A5C3L527_COPMA|nr:proteasome 26S subunit [Coprinopsis marcescibilis]